MAAKKDTAPKTAAPAADKKAALETALAQIEKQFGKGAVMKLGANVTMQVDAIPTGSLGLDLALGIGGVPRGRIVEVYGPESSGKTTLALQILAEAQKMGGEVAFIDVEHALDPTYAAALGVDIDSLLVSQPDTGEQAMEICEALVRSGAIDAVVVDSVAAMVPRAEIEGEMGDSHVGLQARLMSQALRKLTGVIGKTNTVCIFINFLHEGDEIVISVAEHHSNMVPWQRVAKATGAKLVYMYPGENGRLTTEELDKKITPKTKVVAVAMVSNVLGLRAPVEEIVKRAHAVGAVVVLDCAQSAPHTPVDVKKLDVDFAACSAHKLYAPMGVGALYARAGLLEKMPPFMSGGDMIGAVHESGATWADGPRKFEAGTRNVGGEVGFAAAIDYMKGIGWEAMETHEHALLDRMLAGMRAMPWLTVYGEPVAEGRYGVVSFNVNDVHPHDVATILDAGGVAVRAGHHCAQPLMEFLGIGSCCRASVAIYNTPEDGRPAGKS